MSMSFVRAIRRCARWTASRLHFSSDAGASAVEYGVMIAMIAAVVLISVLFLGQQTSGTFSCTASSISSSTQAC
jgi:Flp pilus assembly pilin Flp